MPEGGLDRLKEGNARFVGKQPKELVARQDPFAVVLCCSDSRVPVETIFDQPVGSLFVIRTAGHAVGPIELESIQFALEALDPNLVVVLGHQNCGAVDAARKGKCSPHILAALAPDLEKCATMNEAVTKNTLHTVLELKSKKGFEKLPIYGAVYSLETGAITFIS